MSETPQKPDALSGPIAWMARHSVAANLLMLVCIVGGLYGITRTKQEIFPEFELDMVSVSVPYPGASPVDVEQSILLPIEEQVRAIEGVKHINSSAREGSGIVNLELLGDADPDQVLADVKSAIDRVPNFPADAERETVQVIARRRTVVSLVLSGDLPIAVLHRAANRVYDELVQSPDITQVEMRGLPPREISIEIKPEALENLKLSTDMVAQLVREASLDLPSGELETSSGEILVRVAGRRYSAAQFADIVTATSPNGGRIRLGDVASIKDGYRDDDLTYFFNNKRAIEITVYRIGDQTPMGVAQAVRDCKDSMASSLPAGIELSIWDDDSIKLVQRIDLLVKNAMVGLTLVIVVLALFLNIRLAFWVAMGIPISFLGAFVIVPHLGASINLVTLFALIVALGLVVDDAIIVGENAYHKIQQGLEPKRAAIEGASEMTVPVVFAILSTMVTFTPLMMVPGVSGKIFFFIPVMVVTVLTISVIESFFILPAHVAHMKSGVPRWLAFVEVAQRYVAARLQRFIDGYYMPLLRLCVNRRFTTIVVFISLFVVAIGATATGKVPFSYFPDIQGNIVSATIRYPYGTNQEVTEVARAALAQAFDKTVDAYKKQHGDIVVGAFAKLGEANRGRDGSGANITAMEVELIDSADRDFSSADFSRDWRANLAELPGVEAIIFSSASGPGGGSGVSVQLSHSDEKVLAEAATALAAAMGDFDTLINVENGFANGKPQLDLRLREGARNLGITTQSLARQVRGNVFGAQAIREQQGRDEVRVMVRLPEDVRQSEYVLESMRIRTPAGSFVPLLQVAEVRRSRAATVISREDGRRVVDVSAALAEGVRSPRPVIEALQESSLPQLREQHQGLESKMVGSQRRRADTFSSLGTNALFALLAIFALIAIPFRSYIQPIVVLIAIPFGFVGALAGHVILGFGLSISSVLGIFALSGVVVNDALVFVDAANVKRREGADPLAAVFYAGPRRLRPILLTSLTTFFGLLPMIFETEQQAQFLVPMAISIGFGVLFATVVALTLVPAIYVVVESMRERVRSWSV